MRIVRALIAGSCLLLAVAGSAQAFCHGFRLFILKETEAGYSAPYWDCNLAPAVGTAARLHFFISCEYGGDQLSHVEVRYPDWPATPTAEQGRMEFAWLADAVSGNLRDGLVLDWSTPQHDEQIATDGGIWFVYRLGSVELERLDEAWLAAPLAVEIGGPWQANFWVNNWGDIYHLAEYAFHFNDAYGNCTLYCPDQPPDCFARHFDPPIGALVPRAIVPFSFEIFYIDCMAYMVYDYEGTVSLNGETLLEFSGWYHGVHSVDIDFSGFAPGSIVPVRIDASTGAHYTMNYIVDETAVAPTSISALKASY